MATDDRIGVSDSWSDGTEWTTGSAPTASDNAVIQANGPYTVTVNSASAALNVTLNAYAATLDLQSTLTIGDEFTLDSGTLEFSGGTLSGGTLVLNGGTIEATYNGNDTLSDVAVQGNLNLSGNSGYLVLTDGTTVSGVISITNAYIELENQSALASDVTLANGYLYAAGGGDALTVDAGVTVQGYGTFGDNPPSGHGSGSITNDGTIDANVSGQYLYVDPSLGFTNDGLAEATGGGTLYIYSNSDTDTNNEQIEATAGSQLLLDANQPSATFINAAGATISGVNATIYIGSTFTNDGTIDVSGGSLNLGDESNSTGWVNDGTIIANDTTIYLRGPITTADVGVIQGTGNSIIDYGAINNTGATLDATQGTFQNLQLQGGSISGGALVDSAGAGLSVNYNGNNTLSDVAVQGPLDLSGGYLVLDNGTTVSGGISLTNATLELRGQSSITGDVTLANNSTLYIDGAPAAAPGSLAVDPANTGVNSSGVVLAGGSDDPNWAFTGASVGAGPAIVLSGGNLYGGWQPDSAASAWIATADSVNPGVAPYTFTETFNVTGDASEAFLLATFYIDDQGTLSLNGHVLGGAGYGGQTVAITDAEGWLQSGSNTLTLTVSSSDNYYDGVRLTVDTPTTIASGAVVSGSGAVADNGQGQGQALVVNQGTIDATGGTLTVEPTGFVNEALAEASAGATLDIGYYYSSTGSTNWVNAADGVISSTGGALNLGGEFTNAGQINATNSAVDLGEYYDYSDTGYWVNAGSITVTGGSLTLGSSYYYNDSLDAWSNTGTITAANTAVVLNGSITLADVGDIVRTGGSIILEGALNAEGATIDLTSGLWKDLTLQGGTIENATLNEDAADVLTVNGGVLDNVTVDGALNVASGTATIEGSTTVSGSINVSNSTLDWNTGNALTGTVTLSDGTLSSNASPFDIGAEGTVQGYGSINVDIDNQGVIDANDPGYTLSVQPSSFTNDGTMEATNGGTLQLGYYYGGYYAGYSFTNNADGVISATNGTLQLSDTFTNAGEITATDSSVDLGGYYDYYDDGRWTNASTGSISVTGGSLTLGSDNNYDNTLDGWANTGTITTDGAAITLEGLTDLPDVGTFNRTGGSITLGGDATLNGEAGMIDATQGAWKDLSLGYDATIENVTLIQDASDYVTSTYNYYYYDYGYGAGTLDNVTVQGGLTLNNDDLIATGGTTVDSLDLIGAAATLFWNQNTAINGPVALSGGTLEGNGSITFGPAAVVQGYGLVGLSFDNQGAIEANVGDQTLTIDSSSFANDGAISVSPGATLNLGEPYYTYYSYSSTNWQNNADGTISAVDGTLYLEGEFTNSGNITTNASNVYLGGYYDVGNNNYWQNTGNITVTGGSLTLGSPADYSNADSFSNTGTITTVDASIDLEGVVSAADLGTFNRTGGSITLQGQYTNYGATLDVTQGLFQGLILDGGTINGGTLIGAVTVTNNDGTLAGVSVQGDLDVQGGNGGALILANSISVSGAIDVIGSASVDFDGETDLTNNLTLDGGNLYSDNSPTGGLAVDSGYTVDGYGTIDGSLYGYSANFDNQGVVDADVSGETLTIQNGGSFTNEGTLEATDGGTLWLNNGLYGGNGNVEVGGYSTVEIGQGIGSDQNVTFAGATGILKVDDLADFAATIVNFQPGDFIDLTNTQAASVSDAGGVLTLSDASSNVLGTITLDGDDPDDYFYVFSDGKGGTYLTASPIPPTPGPDVTAIWDGSNNDWTSSSDWSSNATPGSGDTVQISSGVVTVSDGESVNSATVAFGGDLVIGQNGALSVGGTLTVDGGGLQDYGTITGGTLDVSPYYTLSFVDPTAGYASVLDDVAVDNNLVVLNGAVELTDGTTVYSDPSQTTLGVIVVTTSVDVAVASGGSTQSSSGSITLSTPNNVALVTNDNETIPNLSLADSNGYSGEYYYVTITDNNGDLSATGPAYVGGYDSNYLTIIGDLADVDATLATLSDHYGAPGTDTINLSVTDDQGDNISGASIAVTVTPPSLVVLQGSSPTLNQEVALADGYLTAYDPGSSPTYLTISSTGSVVGYGAITDQVPEDNGDTVNLDNYGTIDADSPLQNLIIQVGDFFNNDGLLEATNGGELDIQRYEDGFTWYNQGDGTISATGGSTVGLGADFSNYGAINVTDSTLYLGDPNDLWEWNNGGTITGVDSTIQIAGYETLSDLGTINAQGGSLQLTAGYIDGQGATLDGTGASANIENLELNGGTLQNATLNQQALNLTFGPNGGTLDNVAVTGDLTVDSGLATLEGGTTVGGEIDVSNSATVALTGYSALTNNVVISNGYLVLQNGPAAAPGSLTIDPADTGVNSSGTVLAGGSNDPNWSVAGQTPAPFSGPAVVLSAANLYYGWTPDDSYSAWIGTSDTAYPTATAPYTFTETFDIAGDPTQAYLAGIWWADDTGALSINGHQVATDNINGEDFGITDAQGWLQSGVNTLTITMTYADNYEDGVRLEVVTPVTIDPGVTVQGSGWITDNYGGSIILNQGTIEADTGTLQIGTTGGFINQGLAEATAGSTLVLGANFTDWVNEDAGVISTDGGTLSLTGDFLNTGSITAAGGELTLGQTNPNDSWTNTGSVTADNADINLEANWQNTGTITVDGGSLYLSGAWQNTGTISADDAAVYLDSDVTTAQVETLSRSGGTLYLDGALDNTSATVDTTQGVFQDLQLQGGTINNGTLIEGAGGQLGGEGTLSDVSVQGGLSLSNGADVTVSDGATIDTTITINDATLDWENTSDIVNDVTLQGGSLISSQPSVTIDADVTIQGYGSLDLTFDNQGVIDADISGQTLTINGSGYTNDGTLEATGGGTLDVASYYTGYYGGPTWTNAADGVISANGSTLQLAGDFTNAGQITATDSTVDLGGNYDFADYGHWTNASTGMITVTGGTLTLGSPSYGADTLDAFSNAGTISATNTAITIDGYVTLADLGSLVGSGDAITIDGAFNAQGATLDATQGLWKDLTVDGTLENATVVEDSTDGLSLGSYATLDNVTVEGSLNLSYSYGVTLEDGTVIQGGVTLYDSNLTLNSGSTIDGPISLTDYSTLHVTGLNDLTNSVSLNNSTLTASNSPSGTLTIDGGVTIQGSGTINTDPQIIDNFGLIQSDVSGQTLTIDPAEFINDGQVSVGPGAYLNLEDQYYGYEPYDYGYPDQIVTNDADGAITATGGTLTISGLFTNLGQITATDSNVTIGGYYDWGDDGRWTNTGTITITGGDLTLGSDYLNNNSLDTWSNAGGTISATDASVFLEGDISFADLGTFDRTGGSLTLQNGALTLTGDQLDLTQGAFDDLTLNDATIVGGTLLDDATDGLQSNSNGSNILDGVSVLGGLNLGYDDYLVLVDGTTIDNAAGTAPATITLGDYASLELRGYTDLVNNIVLQNSYLYGSEHNGAADTLTIDSGVTVSGYGQILDNPYGRGTITLVNDGTVDSNAGNWLFVAPTSFTNNGLVEAQNGGALALSSNDYGYNDVGTFTNLSNGVLTGGTYEVEAGSTITTPRNDAVTTLDATVILSGPNSTFESYLDSIGNWVNLDTSLTSIGAGGVLEVLAARGFGDGTNALADGGLIELQDSTLGEGSLTVSAGGAVTGFGQIASAVDNDGTITASGGLLEITGAVTTDAGQTGLLVIGSNATLQLDGANSDSVAFSDPGVLALGDPADFTGPITNMGLGDAIDLMGLDVTSAILGTDGTTLTIIANSVTYTFTIGGAGGAALTGDKFSIQSDGQGGSLLVLSGASETAIAQIDTSSPIALSDVRVGQSDTAVVDITNAAVAPADGLDVTPTSLTGDATYAGSITGLAPGAEDSSSITVGVNTGTAGVKSGTVALLLNSDGSVSGSPSSLPTGTIAVSGDVFREATASITPPASTIVHVGDGGGVLTEYLDIANSDPADGYSEGLVASADGVSGQLQSASGITSDIAAGASDNSDVSVSFSTNAAGNLSGVVQVALETDGAGVDTLGTLGLGSSPVAVSVTVNNYAEAAFQDLSNSAEISQTAPEDYTVNLGTVLQGSTPVTVDLGAINAAFGPADNLTGDFTVDAGTGFANSVESAISGSLGAQQDQSIGDVTLETSSDGTFSETIVFNPVGSNASGYSGDLAQETLTITGTVEAQASADIVTPVVIADQHVGATPILDGVSVTNSAASGAENLDATIGSPTAGVTDNGGSITGLAPGATDSTSLTIGVTTGAAGQHSGEATVELASDNGLGVTTPLASQQVSVSGDVFRYAAANIAGETNEIVHVGDGGGTVADDLTVSNTDPADGYSEGLLATGAGFSGSVLNVRGTTTGDIAAGASDDSDLAADFSTAAAGVLTGSVTVDLVSDGAGVDSLGETDLSPVDAPVSVTVDNYAQSGIVKEGGDGTLSETPATSGNQIAGGSLATYTLDLGTTIQGGADLVAQLGVINAALDQADLLSASFVGPNGDVSEFGNSGFGSVSGLGAQQVGDNSQVALSSANVGTWTETYELDASGSNASGYNGGLAPELLVITGTVTAPPPPPPQPGPTATAFGDVHITTFDGTYYNFQAEGEFVLAQSTVAGDAFGVQIRLEPWYSGATVTTVQEVAANLGDGDHVTFALGRSQVVWINGSASAASALSITNPLTVGDATISELSSSEYQVKWNTGESITVSLNGSYINTTTQLASGAQPGSVEGLLGADSGAANDFQLADGTVISQPISSTDLYGEFADAWRVTQSSSLLDYGPDQTTASFTDLSFPTDQVSLASLPTNLVLAAEQQAEAAGITDPNLVAAAALDFLVTGNPDAITGAGGVQQTIGATPTVDVSANVITSAAVGISAVADNVVESASGPTAITFEVYVTSVQSTDTVLNYAVVDNAAGDLNAAAFGGTLPTGQVTIAAGQTTAQFTVDVPQGALGTAPDEVLAVAVAGPAGFPIVAPQAQTSITNNEPEPGSPAQPLLGLQAGAGSLSGGGTGYTFNLGAVVQGESISADQFVVLNGASAPADNLGGTLASSGAAFVMDEPDTLPTIAAGGNYNGVFATADTGQVGEQSNTVTFDPTDSNSTGYDAALSPITLTLEENVLAPAIAEINPGAATPLTVNLGTIRAGLDPSGDPNALITIENAATSGSAGLDATFGASAGGAFASGEITDLGAGQSNGNAIEVGLSTGVGGVKSGTVTLNFASDAGDGNTEGLPSQSVTVDGTVYVEGEASLAPTNFVISPAGSATQTLTVSNLAPAGDYSEGIEVTAISASGQLSDFVGATGDIAAGGSDDTSLTVTLPNTGGELTAGTYTGTITYDVTTDGTGIDSFGKTDLGHFTQTVTYTVSNPAVAAIVSEPGAATLTKTDSNDYTLNFGNLTVGDGYVTGGFGIENAATGSPTDSLVGQLQVSSNPSLLFVNGGFQEFNLSAGGIDATPQVAFTPTSAGEFTETVQVNPSGSNAEGEYGLPTQTITAEANVLPVEITADPTADDVGGNGQVDFSVTNVSTTDTLTVSEVGFGGAVQSASGTTGELAPGASDPPSLEADFATTATGNLTGTVQFDVYDNTTNTDLGDVTVPVALAVNNPGVPEVVKATGDGTVTAGAEPNTYVFNLGTTVQYGANLIGSLGVLNAAIAPSDAVFGTFTGPTGDPQFLNAPVPYALATSVPNGQTEFAGLADLTTQDVGTFTETVIYHPEDVLANGTTVALPDETILIEGTVVAPPPPPPPPRATAVAWGDVHLTTFDGLLYNFQAAGEFTLAQSTVAGNSFDVQIRLQPYSPGATVSVMTQIAAKVGTDRVTFGTGRTDNTVWINGAASTLSPTNNSITLNGGVLTEIGANQYQIVWNTGEVLNVTSAAAYLNADLTLSSTDGPGSVQGLLGSDSGVQTDFVNAQGQEINPGNNTTITTAQLYGEFASAWQVTNSNTLFDYANGQSPSTFDLPNFPYSTVNLSSSIAAAIVSAATSGGGDSSASQDGSGDLNDLPASVIAAATQLVIEDGITNPALQQDAILDYLVTGDPNIITYSQNVQQTGDNPTGADVTNSGGGTSVPAVGVTASAVTQVEAAGSPTTVTFTAYLTGTSTTDTVVDYSVVSPDSAYLDAAAYGGTLPSGQVTIAAGQTTATFQITVPADALGANATGAVGVVVTVPSDETNTIFAPAALTTLVNSQPEPGNLATPTFAILQGAGQPTVSGDTATLNLGTLIQGQTVGLQVAVDNTSTPPGDSLTGSVTDSGTGGSVVTGDGGLPDLVPGQGYDGIQVAVGTAATGSFTETLTLNPTDTNDTGYTGALPTQTLAITDTVVGAAEATVNNGTTINLGAIRVSNGTVTGGTDTTALSVTNSAATGSAALDATFAASGDATVSGSIAGLAAGSTDSTDVTVGLGLSGDGSQTGQVTLDPTSDAGGGNTLAGASQTVNVEGVIYHQATASITVAPTIILHVGDPGTVNGLTVENTASTDGYSEDLIAQATGFAGGVTAANGETGLIAAGASDSSSLSFDVSTAASGEFDGTVSIDLTSNGTALDGLSAIDIGTVQEQVNYAVDSYAQASVELASGSATLTQTGASTYTLALGNLLQGAGTISDVLGVLNSATGLADLLSGTITASDNDGFVNSGLAAFSGLGAGAADTAPTISLSTSSTGAFSETLTIDPTGSNASGYSGALAPITVTVTGAVVASTSQSFTLTTGVDTINGGGGVNTVNAPGSTLTTGDQINAGDSGFNTLALLGGGSFNLAAPTTLTGIETITAEEGQPAYTHGSLNIPSTEQTIALRNGLNATVNVLPDPSPNSANPNAPGIVIYGANNADVINLGSGADTVVLGSAAETVNGGAGADLYYETAATIGATIKGGTGTNTLVLEGGGVASLGAADTNLTQINLWAAASAWTFSALSSQNYSITDYNTGADVITTGDGKDTVELLGGNTTVNGGSGDDSYIATATGAGSTINGGAGTNTLTLIGGGTAVLGDDTNLTYIHLAAASTAWNFTASGSQSFTLIDYNSGADVITIGSGDDTVVLAGGNTTVNGGDGDDNYRETAASAGSVIKGGTGTNTLTLTGGGVAALGDDTGLTQINLWAATTAWTFSALSAQNYSITDYNTGADVITTGNGNDIVEILGAATTVNGGNGADGYVETAASAGATIKGGTGTNTLTLIGGGVATLGKDTNLTYVHLAAASTAWTFNAGGAQNIFVTDYSTTADTITLGAGSDTVRILSANTTINGGSGHDLYYATAATVGATINGGTGYNELLLTGGGTVSLASDTNINQLVLDGAAVGQTDPAWTVNTAGLQKLVISDADTQGVTITLGAGDLLRAGEANINGSTLYDFAAGEKIDITNVPFTTKDISFTEDSSNTFGTLTIGSGPTASKVILFGQFQAAGFQETGDGASGEYISYMPPSASSTAIVAPH